MSVAGFTFLSRCCGFVREVVIAHFVGAGAHSDTLMMAMKIPAFFRRMFAEGAFNASFIPLFSKSIETKGADEAKAFFRTMFYVLAGFLLVFVGVFELFAPKWCAFLAPGWVKTPETFSRFVTLARVLFPYILFISLTAMFGGVLNTFGRFAPWSSSQAVGNLFLLGAFFAVHTIVPEATFAMATATVLSSVVMCLWVLVPTWRSGFSVGGRGEFRRFRADLGVFFKRFWPAALVASSGQVTVWISMAVCSLLPAGSASYLVYSERLFNFPYSMISVTMATVLLPMLSRQVSSGENADVEKTQRFAFQFVCFCTLPMMVLLFVLAEPMVAACFLRGRFTAPHVVETAKNLRIYAVSLPAFVLIKTCSTMFFAHQDTRTPLWGTGINVALDAVLCYGLGMLWGHSGIALGSSIAIWVAALTILVLAKKRLKVQLLSAPVFLKTLGATLGMTVALFGASEVWAFWKLDPSAACMSYGMFPTLGLSAFGLVAFAAFLILFRLSSWSDMHAWTKNALVSRKK